MSTGPDSARFESSQNSPWMTEYERSSPSSPPQLVGRSSSGPASAAEPASSRSCVSSSAPASSGSKSCSATPNAKSDSSSDARARRTVAPPARARATAASSSAVLPIPAWPSTRSRWPPPADAAVEQLVDRPQLLLPFEEDGRLLHSGDWCAFGQKTGELP